MLKVSHTTMIFISGLVWIAVGCFLLPLGLKLLTNSAEQAGRVSYPIYTFLSPYLGNAQTVAMLLTAFGLFIGYFKGKFALGKSVRRSVTRILTLPNPASITQIYSFGYYLLFGFMVLLGMSIKWVGLSDDVRGFVDVAIGSALINGAMIYFRLGLAMRNKAVQG